MRFANGGGGSDQFDVIIVSGGQTITAGDVNAEQHSRGAEESGGRSNDLLVTPTQVFYRDDRPPVAGLAAGSKLTLPGAPVGTRSTSSSR